MRGTKRFQCAYDSKVIGILCTCSRDNANDKLPSAIAIIHGDAPPSEVPLQLLCNVVPKLAG
jgi:hypothetical protein